MKYKYYKLLILSAALLSFTGCKKGFLDPKPSDRLSEEAVWKSTALIESFLNDNYNDLSDGIYSINGIGDDNQMLVSLCDEGMSDYEGYERRNVFVDGTLNADNVEGSRFNRLSWANQFYFVSRANEFLERMNTNTVLDDATKKRFIAEMKTLKAFRYFNLLRRYGGLPLFDKPFVLGYDYTLVKRSTADETIGYILKLLNEAITDLPATAATKGRLEKGAAKSLKSRLLLYAASPLFSSAGDVAKWTAAAAAAKEIIDDGVYVLETSLDNLKKIFITPNLFGTETIFSQQTTIPVGAGGSRVSNVLNFNGGGGPLGARAYSYFAPTQQMVDAFEMSNGKAITETSSGYNDQNPYSNRDPRLDIFICHHNSPFKNRLIDVSEGGLDKARGDYKNPSGYTIRKFLDEAVFTDDGLSLRPNVGSFPTPWIHFRYAEILLNYAEAINEAEGPGNAYTSINLIRNRAGMPDLPAGLSQSEMRERIHNERRVELSFEDHRYYDVRRWKIAETTQNYVMGGVKITKDGTAPGVDLYEYEPANGYDINNDRKFLPHQYFWPITRSELQASPGLVQNPGYN